jgi:hypothetical protein
LLAPQNRAEHISNRENSQHAITMNSLLLPCVVAATALGLTSGPTPSDTATVSERASTTAVVAPAPLPLAAGTSPLTITCPGTAKTFCGDSIDPSITGEPTVSGGCDRHPVVTYSDTIVPPTCAADRFDFVVARTWTATDSCGDSASCTQRIDVIKRILFLDMHPTSCPNPVNISGNGVIPAALLGTANFDVTTIDPNSIQLWGYECDGGPVSPTHVAFEDVATPYTGNQLCGCNTLHGDGFVDLTLKFDKQAVVQALHLQTYTPGTFVHIVVTGTLSSGCNFLGIDCIRVQ